MKKFKFLSICVAFAMVIGIFPVLASADTNTVTVDSNNVTCVKSADEGYYDVSVPVSVTVTDGGAAVNGTEVTLLVIGNHPGSEIGVTGDKISVTVNETPTDAYIYYVDQANTGSGNTHTFTFQTKLPNITSDDDFIYAWAGSTDATRSKDLKIELSANPYIVSAASITGLTGANLEAPASGSTDYTLTTTVKDKYDNVVAVTGDKLDVAVYSYSGDIFSVGTASAVGTDKIEWVSNEGKLKVYPAAKDITDKIALTVGVKNIGGTVTAAAKKEITGLTISKPTAGKIEVSVDNEDVVIPGFVGTFNDMENATKDTAATVKVTAAYKSAGDELLESDDTTFTLVKPDNSDLGTQAGISIEKTNGKKDEAVVSIDADAAGGTVTAFKVKATNGTLTEYSAQIDLAKDTLAETFMKVDESMSVVKPSGDTPATVDLAAASAKKAKIYDQYKQEMSSAVVNYTIDTPPTGVSINGTTLTVTKDADLTNASPITIKATSATTSSFTGNIALSIVNETLKLDTVEITTAGTIAVPTKGNTAQLDLEAVMKDQYNTVWTDGDATYSWEITAGSRTGISLTANNTKATKLKLDNTAGGMTNDPVTVKVTANSGGNSANISKAITLTKVTPEVKKVTASANPATVAVPTGSNTATSTLSATAEDQYGDPVDATAATFTTTAAATVATISGNTLTVLPGAAGTPSVPVVATLSGVDSAAINVTLTTSGEKVYTGFIGNADNSDAELADDGANKVTVTVPTDDTPAMVNLTVTKTDQYNISSQGEAELKANVAGVSIVNGSQVKITKEALEAVTGPELKVELGVKGASGTWAIYLTKAAPVATKVEITPDSGSNNVQIPEEGTTSVSYTAKVVDQYGDVMNVTATDVTWTVPVEAITGVTFPATKTGDKFIFTVGADTVEGNFKIKATYGGIDSAEATVAMSTKPVSTATKVVINGATSIKVYDNTITESYGFVVLDQNDNKMEGGSVTWSLDSSLSGVSINSSTGVMTVSSDASNGTVGVVASLTGSDLKSDPYNVSIKKIKTSSDSSDKKNNNNNGGGSFIYPVGPVNPVNPVNPDPVKPIGSDVPADSWAKAPIQSLIGKGILKGDSGSGDIRPDDSISREETVTVLLRALNIPATGGAEIPAGDNSSEWAAGALAAAKANGIINGDDSGNYNGANTASRAETIVMIARAMQISSDNLSVLDGYADADSIPDWAKAAVAGMIEKGLLKGYEDNTLKLGNEISRAEAFTLVNRILDAQ